MSTNSKPGIGAKLNYWDTSGSTGAWVEIVEMTALDYEGASREVIEVFKLNTPDEAVNKVQGTLNYGAITATILYTLAEFALLKAQEETRGNQDYQIVLPGGAGLEWSGFISELPLAIGSDDVMQSEMVITVDGKADFSSTAAAAPAA